MLPSGVGFVAPATRLHSTPFRPLRLLLARRHLQTEAFLAFRIVRSKISPVQPNKLETLDDLLAQHLGEERFVMAYALGYLQGGGYRANPLEVMAYDLQDYFEKGGQPINVEATVRQQLDGFIPALEGAFK